MEKIKEIEEKMRVGQVPPPDLAEYGDQLAGLSSSLMDEQLELQRKYAGYFENLREHVKSDKAVEMAWRRTENGVRELELEMIQRKIKTLSVAIGRHLKVAHDQAYNRY